MANTANYIATARGYIDGRVIEPGEAFVADFRVLKRDDKGLIARDKAGNAERGELQVPSWAEPATKGAAAAAAASDNDITDVNYEELSKSALQAVAAEKGVPVEATMSKAELITAIKAAKDFTR